MYPSIVVLYVVFSFFVLAAIAQNEWLNIVIGGVLLLSLTVGAIFIFRSAIYVLGDDDLHIKGINNGKKEDRRILFKDILSLLTYRHNNVDQLRILFWAENRAEYIDIPLPHPAQSKVFLKNIDVERKKHDFSHIITAHIDMSGNVSIKQENCNFLDYCQLDNSLMIALVQDKQGVILLGDCSLFETEEIVNTSPPETKKMKYIYCNFFYVQRLDYKTVDEALIDTEWNAFLEKDVRKVDILAHNKWCDADR